MSQPPGFSHPQYPNHICKLNKALYGLKQAPRAWFSWLTSQLLAFGFKSSKSDSSLSIYYHQRVSIFFLIYVDDIIITGSSPSTISMLIHFLKIDFAIKELGDLNFFLGVKVIKNTSSILLSQKRYIVDLLHRTNMLEAKPVSSPMTTSTNLSAFEGDTIQDVTLYRNNVGALQYLALTRLDKSFMVNKLAQFKRGPQN